MPLLDIWATLENPSWLMFALCGLVGLGGLAAIFLLYPMGRED